MRLIDADALVTELQKDEARFDKEAEDARNNPSYTECYSEAMWSRANGIRDAMIEIYDAQSIEIIRCRECKYAEVSVSPITGLWCTRFGINDMAMEDDDFCSYGERLE